MAASLRIAFAVAALAGCGELAWDTRVAERRDVRLAMAQSVQIGRTTEREFVLRWGNPLQKNREGAQTDFIYRSRDGGEGGPGFVIVTFQNRLATSVRTSDFETCRAVFARRIPGYGFDMPDTFVPLGSCNATLPPGAGIVPHDAREDDVTEKFTPPGMAAASPPGPHP